MAHRQILRAILLLLFDVVDKNSRYDGGKLNCVCDERTDRYACEVVGYPEERVDQRPKTVFSAVFLTDAHNERKRRYHCDKVKNMLEYQHIYNNKRKCVY